MSHSPGEAVTDAVGVAETIVDVPGMIESIAERKPDVRLSSSYDKHSRWWEGRRVISRPVETVTENACMVVKTLPE